MLFIDSITLTNFGRHKKVHADFNGYVPGITGPNGLGKSTVLQALQLAYSGTIDHPDPLKAFIRRSSGSKPPKFAEVESKFHADGKPGRIVRRITRTTVTHKLWWDGAAKPITKAGAIAEIMFNILGVDKKAINSTVFIRQGEMSSMFGLETDRRDFYTRLLMLGHLEKISRQVEMYRETTAASVQDLGAVRDQAESAAAEAAEYFDASDSALASITDRSGELKAVRRVQGAFEDYDEAKEAGDKAIALLKPIVEEGFEPPQWIEKRKRELSEAQAELENLTKRKSAHLAARGEFDGADKHLRQINETMQKFLAVHEVEAKIAQLGDLDQDPAPALKRLEETLAKFDRLESIDIELPPLKLQLDEVYEPKLKALQERLPAIQEAYDNSRELYALTLDNKKMREEFLKHLSDHTQSDCPLCHAGSPPDEARIREDLAADLSRLAELKVQGTLKKEDLNKTETELDSVRRRVEIDRTKVENLTREEKQLKIETSLASRSDIEKSIDAGKLKVQAYAAKAFEHERLAKELKALAARVENLRIPTQNDQDAAQAAFDATKENLAAAQWSSSDDVAEGEASAKAQKIRLAIEKVQGQVSDYESATRRFDSAKRVLEEAFTAAPDGMFGSGVDIVTFDDVLKVVEDLEAKQKEHDEARGRKEAANEQLKKANGRVTELETRIAEQGHRLDLVKDLASLRDTFKPTGASLEYLNYKFGQIATLAGDYLAESGADFMVAPSEELPLSFDFLRTDREDEVWMGQSRMSGGQKVRLAVATLRAIHAMVMPNVGLLVLDEPTTHLDEEAKRSMAEMLQKIGEEGTLQMIVCDHSPTLVEAFSDTIEIPG